ncbi:MAG: archease [Candidatus Hydrothermia bacterium]
MGYEILNHTADFGVRLFGNTLEELFKSGFLAIIDAMVEIKGQPGKVHEFTYENEAETLEDLLVDFLSEIIFQTIVYSRIFVNCEISVQGKSLKAKLFYENFDPTRHRLKKEIKSVTYHNLHIIKTESGYEATVICDV